MWWFGVAISGSSNDLSRMTDAREKGRIGIFGSALSYAGSYGRVTSESLGRDLNPLGRGDGGSYVAGGLNLGRIAPRLPKNAAASGTGNSVNNCGQGSPGPAADPMGGGGAGGPGQTPRGTDCECVSCCRGWGVSYSSQLQTGPAPCGKACDYCHAGAGGSCQDQECACRGCLWDYYNSAGEHQPSRYEVMCEKCCCDGCPCSSGSGGGGGGGTTGPWGPGANGGGGGMPGFPPGWGIMGGGVTGPWRLLDNPGGGLPGDFPPHVWEPPIYTPPSPPYLRHKHRSCAGAELQKMIDELIACLQNSNHYLAPQVIAKLRTCHYYYIWPSDTGGWGFSPPGGHIFICLAKSTEYPDWARCLNMHILTHESIHQLFFYNDIGGPYGINKNLIDNMTEDLLRTCCCSTYYENYDGNMNQYLQEILHPPVMPSYLPPLQYTPPVIPHYPNAPGMME